MSNDEYVKAIMSNNLPKLKAIIHSLTNVSEAKYQINLTEYQRANNYDNYNYGRQRNDDDRIDDDVPSNGLTLLHVAAFYNSLECFRFLEINNYIDIKKESTSGFYPLHYACRSGSYEVAMYILTKDPSQARKQVEGSSVQLLYCATVGGDPEIMAELFKNGATMTSGLNDEPSLTKKAIGVHNIEILQILLKNQKKKNSNQDNSEFTPAMNAIIAHNPDALDAVYRHKADIKAFVTDSKGDSISMFSLICSLDTQKVFKHLLIKYLKEARTECIEPPKNHPQSGVCHWACQYCDIDVAELMFQTVGADPNRLDHERRLGPHCLTLKKGPDVIKMLNFLIDKGLKINLPNSKSLLECFITVISPNYEAIEFLIDNGANYNVRHSSKNMSLYDFVKSGNNTKMKKAFKIIPK
ncbi:hypothetical protein M9Y10_018894 [Tritrichomonas musculus]|uniref:Ankyrin repeat protein n=1 Tax=Tritrichomonas musculus TaxID=1915356 RepID=A0ABR2HJ04_9EUKA